MRCANYARWLVTGASVSVVFSEWAFSQINEEVNARTDQVEEKSARRLVLHLIPMAVAFGHSIGVATIGALTQKSLLSRNSMSRVI